MGSIRLVGVTGLCAALAAAPVAGQGVGTPPNTIEGFQSAAKAAAGVEFPGTFARLCVPPPPSPAGGGGGGGGGGAAPAKETWYAEPAKIGDNFYFLGEKAHSSFALVAQNGESIIIDALYDYATPDEVVGGLKALGLDPNKVKYVVISHAHGDHDGGVKYLQDAIPGVTIVYGAGDWPAVTARGAAGAKRSGPANDGTDGRVLSVGDVSVRIVTMPGHTPGTLSFLFEFKDGGKPIRVAYVGGTALQFNSEPAYYDTYIASSEKVAAAAAAYGATALMSNHTEFDMSYFKAHTAAHRSSPGVRNPYDVGAQNVANYFDVIQNCAKAAKLRATVRR